MTPETITRQFTRADGSYLFARWGRPIAPVVFGVADETLPVIKGAIEAVVALAGHSLAETDPELGANLMVFFLRDWAELSKTPHLDRLIPELSDLVERLEAAGANQYRLFRFDEAGAIRACFAFNRMTPELEAVPAEAIALGQAAQVMLLWSDTLFADRGAVVQDPESGAIVLDPEVAETIRVAYDPVLPDVAGDASHALRLAARIGAPA